MMGVLNFQTIVVGPVAIGVGLVQSRREVLAGGMAVAPELLGKHAKTGEHANTCPMCLVWRYIPLRSHRFVHQSSEGYWLQALGVARECHGSPEAMKDGL